LITLENADPIIQQTDDYLESLVNNKQFSGSVLLARNNQILLIKGYGCSEYILQDKNTSQTIYRIGSVTKPFTAIIILKLYETKQLNLNTKLSYYYPDYPHGNQITIKHLLSNTSGIDDYTEMEIFENKCQENLTTDQLIEIFKNEPLKFKPGSKYSYSNSNVNENILVFFIKKFSLVYFIRFNYRKSNWKIL
jgi:CubicO group peptidase (beta-lactamase class C family)